MKDRTRCLHRMVLAVLALLFWTGVQSAAAAEGSAFFEGKTMRIVVGSSPGGGFDTFARLLARHLGRFLPGQPRLIVQNMPGAGSMVAANRVYAMQPGDGLTLVNFNIGMVLQAVVKDPVVRFDPPKYLWIGHPSLAALPQVLWIRSDLPVRSLDDLRAKKEPIALGPSGVGNVSAVLGEFLRFIGLPVRNVYGYRGTATTTAALERKEIDAILLNPDTIQTIYRRFLDEKLVRPILTMGSDPRLDRILAMGTEPQLSPLPPLPAVEDFKLAPEQRELAEFLTTSWRLLRLYAVPPGTPPQSVGLLREAFLNALNSSELKKEARRLGVVVAPSSGERWNRPSGNSPRRRRRYSTCTRSCSGRALRFHRTLHSRGRLSGHGGDWLGEALPVPACWSGDTEF